MFGKVATHPSDGHDDLECHVVPFLCYQQHGHEDDDVLWVSRYDALSTTYTVDSFHGCQVGWEGNPDRRPIRTGCPDSWDGKAVDGLLHGSLVSLSTKEIPKQESVHCRVLSMLVSVSSLFLPLFPVLIQVSSFRFTCLVPYLVQQCNTHRCGPCRLSVPVVKEVMKQFANDIDVLEVCTDDLPDVAAEAGIVSIPTIQMYHKGEVMDTIIGCVAKNVLASAVTKVLEDIFGVEELNEKREDASARAVGGGGGEDDDKEGVVAP